MCKENVELARTLAHESVISIETTGTVYEIKFDGITKLVADEAEAHGLIRVLVKAVGLEYFVSAGLLISRPDLHAAIDEAASKLRADRA